MLRVELVRTRRGGGLLPMTEFDRDCGWPRGREGVGGIEKR